MAKKLDLPDPDTFTRQQLADRWKCDLSLIDSYINNGQLKATLPSAIRDSLQEWMFYKCDAGEKQLLDAIRHDEPLSSFTEIQGEFIPCPKYLYVSVAPNSTMQADSRKIHDTLVYAHGLDPDTDTEPFSGKYVLVRYFLDLYGNALIPIEEDKINFLPVKKEHLDSLTIISLEEVKRFECENNIEQESKNVSVIHRQKKSGKQDRENADTSSETNDAFAFKPAPNPDPWLSKKAVSKLIGNSTSYIDKKVTSGEFPKPVKIGRHPKWRTSVVVLWMEEREKESEEKQTEKRDKESNE